MLKVADTEKVVVYEALIRNDGQVRLTPARDGVYKSNISWHHTGLDRDFHSEKRAVAEQLQDALNWVRKCAGGHVHVQLIGGGTSVPSGVFWIIVSPH